VICADAPALATKAAAARTGLSLFMFMMAPFRCERPLRGAVLTTLGTKKKVTAKDASRLRTVSRVVKKHTEADAATL
jgi:enoyl-CoA hydratase/carnithine racemase